MTVYVFDGTMDGLLTAVFDAFALKDSPEAVLTEGDALPLFCERTYTVHTDEEKARRVWAGLEKQLSRETMKLISVSWLAELSELNAHLFRYICKVFRQGDIARNFADPDVLAVTNIARRVLHEQLRMKQFIRFQKAKDGTYLAVVSPDHNVPSTTSRIVSTTSLGSSMMPNVTTAITTTVSRRSASPSKTRRPSPSTCRMANSMNPY